MGGLPQAVRIFGGEDRLETLLADLSEAVFKPPTEFLLAANEQQPIN